MPIERKLAAIMFTDIAGYTALSAKDENKALELLDTQKQILTPIIEKFNGTLHKEMGDGLLFTFPTVTEAVKCGIKIQEQTKSNDDLNLRVGIHEGEITLKDGDALGDDVNVASRIEAFSPSGGIAISSKVQQNISSLPEYKTSYLGKPELKGVTQKVEIFCIISHGLPKSKKLYIQTEKEQNRKYYKEILISTLFGIIVFSYLPQFFKSNDNNSLQSSFSQVIINKNALVSDLISTEHENDILYELDRADSLLALNAPEHNNDAIANIAMLMAIDNTQGDYYSLFGQAFYQRWRFNPKSEELMLEAIKNIDIAIEKKNINIDYLALAYMTKSDICLKKNDLSKASENIKKALQVKRLSPITDRFKLITLMKLQKMEYKK